MGRKVSQRAGFRRYMSGNLDTRSTSILASVVAKTSLLTLATMLARPASHPDEKMAFAGAKTISRRGSPPRPLSRELDFLLEQFRNRRLYG